VTPESVLTSALRARDEWRYDDVVALVDPVSCAERFQQFCEMSRPMTLERFAEHYPNVTGDALPDAFRNWRQRAVDPEANIARVLPGITSYEALIKLDAASFLARWMANEDDRTSLVERLRERGRAVPAYLLGTPEWKEYVILGSVLETDELAHVLYREVNPGVGGKSWRGPVEYEALRRQSDGTWRLLADHYGFLRGRGGSATILPEEFADLWDTE
jgi:hypothetical protein